MHCHAVAKSTKPSKSTKRASEEHQASKRMRARIAGDAWVGGARPSRANRTERALQPQAEATGTAEELLTDGGDIGDDEIFQVSADVR